MSKNTKVTEWKFTLEKNAGGGHSSKDSLKEPLGYKQDITDVSIRIGQKNGVSQKEMLEARAWAAAKAPLSNLPMMMFIFWMTGSSLSIYTIMFSMQMATQPFTQLFNVEQAFAAFEHKQVNLLLPKLLYCACTSAGIFLGLYKFSNMGIIPVQPADWAGLFESRIPMESNQVLVPSLN